MNPTPEDSLGGFERRLLGELRAVVEQRATRELGVRSTRRPATAWPGLTLRRSLIGAAGIACIAGVVSLVSLSGSSPGLAQAFPIFARPATLISPGALASILSDSGASLRNARLDVRHARAFSTPLGTGYVVSDTHANVICVAAPGFTAPGARSRSWGAACGNARLAKRDGAGGLLTYGSVGQTSYVAILPNGATATVRRFGGAPRPLPVPDGVLAIVVHGPSVIATRIAGHTISTVLRPPVRSDRVSVPTRAEVAAPLRFRITQRPRYPELSATFRTRYPVREGKTAYVLEYAPVPGTRPTCPGDAIDEQTNRDIRAGTQLTLHGGAPNCAGRWRIAVYLAASRGDVHYPGQAWARPLNGAMTPPPGSGDQIVAAETITIR